MYEDDFNNGIKITCLRRREESFLLRYWWIPWSVEEAVRLRTRPSPSQLPPSGSLLIPNIHTKAASKYRITSNMKLQEEEKRNKSVLFFVNSCSLERRKEGMIWRELPLRYHTSSGDADGGRTACAPASTISYSEPCCVERIDVFGGAFLRAGRGM